MKSLLTMEPSLQKVVPFVQVTASSILQEVLARTRSRKNVYVTDIGNNRLERPVMA
jgi:hypothetical protein